MKFKSVSPWWPLCLLALSGAAHADLEPFSVGASETLEHQSNVNRTPDAQRQADWLSTTEFNAALDQTIGRERLRGSAAFDISRYKHLHNLDANGYSVAGSVDWSTIGDLAGSFGGDSRRHQYFYGLNGELTPTGTVTTSSRNLETDNHVFANAQLGGMARWTINVGVDANERKFSNPAFSANEERQWSANAGTSYQTSPDLSFGITGNVTHGLYPNFVIDNQRDDFDLKSLSLTTRWQATGVSRLNATLGYSDAEYTGQSPNKFLSGSLDWTWTPPSHFTVVFGLARNSNANTEVASSASPTQNDLTGHSINNVAHLSVSYELTPKTSLALNAQYTDRHYDNAVVPTSTSQASVVDGSNRTTLVGLTAHYQATRTADLGCSVSREVRRADSSIILVTPNYSNNLAMCTASIKFD